MSGMVAVIAGSAIVGYAWNIYSLQVIPERIE